MPRVRYVGRIDVFGVDELVAQVGIQHLDIVQYVEKIEGVVGAYVGRLDSSAQLTTPKFIFKIRFEGVDVDIGRRRASKNALGQFHLFLGIEVVIGLKLLTGIAEHPVVGVQVQAFAFAVVEAVVEVEVEVVAQASIVALGNQDAVDGRLSHPTDRGATIAMVTVVAQESTGQHADGFLLIERPVSSQFEVVVLRHTILFATLVKAGTQLAAVDGHEIQKLIVGVVVAAKYVGFFVAVIGADPAVVPGFFAYGVAQIDVAIRTQFFVFFQADIDDPRVALGIVLGRRIGDQFNGFDFVALQVAQKLRQIGTLHGRGAAIDVDADAGTAQHGDVVVVVDHHPWRFAQQVKGVAARSGDAALYVEDCFVGSDFQQRLLRFYGHALQLIGHGLQFDLGHTQGLTGLYIVDLGKVVWIAHKRYGQAVLAGLKIGDEVRSVRQGVFQLHDRGVGGFLQQHIGVFQGLAISAEYTPLDAAGNRLSSCIPAYQ